MSNLESEIKRILNQDRISYSRKRLEMLEDLARDIYWGRESEKAAILLLTAARGFELRGDKKSAAHIYQRSSKLMSILHEVSLSCELLERSANLYAKCGKDEDAAHTFLKASSQYHLANNNKKAVECYELALLYAKKIGIRFTDYNYARKVIEKVGMLRLTNA